MKRLGIFSAIITIVVVILAALSFQLMRAQQPVHRASRTNNVLTIYNWGEYIDPSLIKKFEKQTGYQVNYVTFDSNEAMYTKVKQGGTAYDIAVPSDYMVDKMRQEGLLEPLDLNKIPNVKYYDPQYMNLAFDPNNHYSLPYFWGTLGIAYNDQRVKRSEIQDWNDLWSDKWNGKIMLTDSARDMLGVALASDNQSVNTTSSMALNVAAKKLMALAPNTQAILADEIMNYMVSGESSLAVVYSGQAAEMAAQNPHIKYVIPKGIGNMWVDNLVIPKTVANKPAAYAFLNFMSDPRNAAQNAEWVGYSTPNKGALKYLPKSLTQDHEWYPTSKQLKGKEVYRNLSPYWTQQYNDLWLQVKMHQ